MSTFCKWYIILKAMHLHENVILSFRFHRFCPKGPITDKPTLGQIILAPTLMTSMHVTRSRWANTNAYWWQQHILGPLLHIDLNERISDSYSFCTMLTCILHILYTLRIVHTWPLNFYHRLDDITRYHCTHCVIRCSWWISTCVSKIWQTQNHWLFVHFYLIQI